MVNGVEGCSEVKYVEVPRVCREEEIVCDFQEIGMVHTVHESGGGF